MNSLIVVYAAALLAVLPGCGGGKARDSEEARTVRAFLVAMKDDDQGAMKDLLSPAWVRDNGVNLAECGVNKFSLLDYVIEEVKGNEVTALVKFMPGAHRLVFRVAKENGRCYIEPSELNNRGWIEPWVRVQKFVE